MHKELKTSSHGPSKLSTADMPQACGFVGLQHVSFESPETTWLVQLHACVGSQGHMPLILVFLQD